MDGLEHCLDAPVRKLGQLTMRLSDFVAGLLTNAAVRLEAVSEAAHIEGFGLAATLADAECGQTLRRVEENATQGPQEFNPAVVLMQIALGYLRRFARILRTAP